MQVTKLVVPKDKVVRRRTWLAAGGSLLVATAGLFGAAGPASAHGISTVVGYTYVDDNTAPTNTIAGFDRHADGSLSSIPGSPFPAGGVGLGAGLASQGAIEVTSDGRYLLAVDAGSNQILSAAHHGRRCAGPCRPACGVGRGQAGQRGGLRHWSGLRRYLFTVNTGSANISSYSINPDGSLVLLGSTPITGGGADIDARLSPDGKYLLVDGAGHNFISVFAVNGGSLSEVPGSPTPLPAGASSSGIVTT